MYGAGISYYGFLVPLSSKIMLNNHTLRPFVYPVYSEFRQMHISPLYEIVYITQCICGYFMYSVTVGTYGLAALFATHACGQIEIIISRLQDLVDGKNFKRAQNIHQSITVIVKGHVQIIR